MCHLHLACMYCASTDTSSIGTNNLISPYVKLSGLAVYGLGLRPLFGRDCGFRTRRQYGCLSIVNVACCQVEVSATGRSLSRGVRPRARVCVCVCVCDRKNSQRIPRPSRGVEPRKKETYISCVYWTVHHPDSWIKIDQLDVTCFITSLFNAQHVSDVNTSILRSLRLICWVISFYFII